MAFLPAGMRNNNPGNIKYVGQPGTTPSVNTDQGDPQAVYATPEAGMAAMYRLLARKYGGGKTTPLDIIAGKGGWTPGNTQAAANIARTAGIGVNDDIGFGDPARAARFMRGLLLQEHGPASNAYSDTMISNAIGSGAVLPTNPVPQSGRAALLAPPESGSGGQQALLPPLLQAPASGDGYSMASMLGEGFKPMRDAMTAFNQGYSADRFMSDMLGGGNPMRNLVFSALGSLFRA